MKERLLSTIDFVSFDSSGWSFPFSDGGRNKVNGSADEMEIALSNTPSDSEHDASVAGPFRHRTQMVPPSALVMHDVSNPGHWWCPVSFFFLLSLFFSSSCASFSGLVSEGVCVRYRYSTFLAAS